MMLGRRGAALALLAAAAPGRVSAQGGPSQGGAATAARPRSSDLWFDPTQLPSFTGTVERYLPNPHGEIDALVFREGPQVVFPPDVADAVRQAAPAGRPIIVWGIRARTAPVITMLAFAPNGEATPVVVDRFYWRSAGRQASDGAVPLTAAGVVRQPYYTPQGEVAGAILEDGSVVLVPAEAASQVKDLLRPGQRLAAAGKGREGPAGKALLASEIGAAADALKPVASGNPPH